MMVGSSMDCPLRVRWDLGFLGLCTPESSRYDVNLAE